MKNFFFHDGWWRFWRTDSGCVGGTIAGSILCGIAYIIGNLARILSGVL